MALSDQEIQDIINQALDQINQDRGTVGSVEDLLLSPNFLQTADVQQLRQALLTQANQTLVPNWEQILGNIPGFSDPATLQTLVDSGFLTAQQAQSLGALNAPVYSNVGSIAQKFAKQGGLRGVEGPYMAAQATAMKNFQTAEQQAANQALLDANNLVTQRQLAAANLAINNPRATPLAQSLGVARIGADAANGGEVPPGTTLPLPPTPSTPSPWLSIIPGLAGLVGTLSLPLLLKYLSNSKKEPTTLPSDLGASLYKYDPSGTFGFGGGTAADVSTGQADAAKALTEQGLANQFYGYDYSPFVNQPVPGSFNYSPYVMSPTSTVDQLGNIDWTNPSTYTNPLSFDFGTPTSNPFSFDTSQGLLGSSPYTAPPLDFSFGNPATTDLNYGFSPNSYTDYSNMFTPNTFDFGNSGSSFDFGGGLGGSNFSLGDVTSGWNF